MKGEALSWFKWTSHNCPLSDWSTFTKALELRFGHSSYTNHQAKLFEIRQTSTVYDYQALYEKISNRVVSY